MSRMLVTLASLLLASTAWSEDAPSPVPAITLPSAFEDGRIQIQWSAPLDFTRKDGADFFLFHVRPKEPSPTWRLTIFDGNIPNPPTENPLRRREWYPFNRLSWLQIHRSEDGTFWAESYVPTGHQWEIDDKNGVFYWGKEKREIHVMVWLANEAALESMLKELAVSWLPLRNPDHSAITAPVQKSATAATPTQ